jgi:chromate reductase
MSTILAVCGSLQARSGNRVLLEAARATAPEGVEVVFFDALRAIPPFDPDVPGENAPEPVRAWRGALGTCDAVLVASPEYGFSLPGVLKNAIDWAIGSGELEGKIVGITASVNVVGRGRRGLEALADTLRAVSARIVRAQSIVRGPDFERDVSALVGEIVAAMRAPVLPPAHGLGILRPSALVLAWVLAFNRADADGIAVMYAEDGVSRAATGSPVQGRAAIRETLARAFTSAPRQLQVEALFEDGDWAILEWSDTAGRRGSSFFQMNRSEIALQRTYGDNL